jgi:hypothetical protein
MNNTEKGASEGHRTGGSAPRARDSQNWLWRAQIALINSDGGRRTRRVYYWSLACLLAGEGERACARPQTKGKHDRLPPAVYSEEQIAVAIIMEMKTSD